VNTRPGPDGPADGLRPVDVLTVDSVADVTPSVRRVVLSGTPSAVAAAGPTVNLLVPRVGERSPHWPRVAKDGRIVWPEGAHGVSLRSYTARRQDSDAGPEEQQPLPAPPAVTVRWLHRGSTPPGESTLLSDAVAGLERPEGDDVFAWVAAESAAVRTIRADLRGRWGLGRAQHHAIGYWRRGRAMSPSG
jgi:NADPH-dependent ferric siderophore reductase